MRTTSEFWVQAYLRLRNDAGKPSVLVRRGAKEAGAIYVKVDRLDGNFDLYEPAMQLDYSEEDMARGERLFRQSLESANVFEIMDKLDAEEKFDTDFWVVETECPEGSHGLALTRE